MMVFKQFMILVAVSILSQPALDNFARWVISDAELLCLNEV